MKKTTAKTKVEKPEVLTKRGLVLKIAEKCNLSQQTVTEVVQMVLDDMTDALGEGKRIEFREFGVFEIVQRKARIGRNPNKPENTVQIPTRKVVKFKPGKKMCEYMDTLSKQAAKTSKSDKKKK